MEICINNAWGTVCSDSYGSRDAKVICQQLGFDTAGAQPLRGSRAAAFGSGSGPIFLSQLDCLGDEASLLDCPTFSPPGLHDCDHTQDAGVRCIGRHYTMHSLSFVWIVLQSHFFFYHYTILVLLIIHLHTYVHVLWYIPRL